MKLEEEKVTLSEGIDIHWENVKTLKVLNDKLLFVMSDDLMFEISGLPSRTVDAVFVAYSRYLKEHAVHR